PTGLWDFRLEAPRASTRHLVLRLPEDLSYRTGDHFGVYPRNRPERVAAVLERLGVAPDTVVVLESDAPSVRYLPLGKPVTAGQLLRDFVELQDPVARADVRRLLPYAACPQTRAELEAMIAEDEAAQARFQRELADRRVSAADLLARYPALRPSFAAFLDLCPPRRPRFYSIASSALVSPRELADRRVSAADLLARYPALRPSFAAFLDLCPPRRPRFYSIASSALVSPRELALTVGTVAGRAWAGAGEYQGVASTYLRDLARGERVTGFLRTPEPAFAPVDDPRLPMILIGPGTGFAP